MRRRSFLIASTLAAGTARAAPLITRPIPSSGERVPAVGMGTWLTFNVAFRDPDALARRRTVLERFFAGGGALIDASPMYGSAEEVLGRLLPDVAGAGSLFSATKVWTPLGAHGPAQMQRSLESWKLARCDLMQVHNLLNWRAHLATLREWKRRGRVRYVGVTTSHGNKHDEMRKVVESEPLDFMQVTYSPADRSAEPLLDLAAARNVAVLVNRPFDGGALLDRLAGEPLPALARELECSHWAPLVLKWELAHPAVTCVIPATSRPDHMDQNMSALAGPLPNADERKALSAAFERVIG